jgi:signal transduction histidine kinase
MSNAPLRILVIEDDEEDRELLRRVLRDCGLPCEVVEAPSFRAALEEYGEGSFDFIFIDNGLPDGAGVNLIEETRRTWRTAGVALVTGLGSEDLAAGAIKNGAVDYVPKRNIDRTLIAKVVGNGVKVARLQTKIQSQNEALQRFARVLAHDLRSPLQAVRVLAEGMLDGTGGTSDEEIQNNAAMMMRYSDRLTQLVSSLEQYNQLNHVPRFENAQTDALLDSAIENLGVEIGLHNVHFERDRLPEINCTPSEIIRLFQNLISNSIKYRSNQPPAIQVWARRNGDPDLWTFHFADNGIGIPASERESVFEEFRRLHSHNKIEGTGLGLSMCRRIVERHGGSIWCEPAVGGGTIFKFTLPVAVKANHRGNVVTKLRARQAVT